MKRLTFILLIACAALKVQSQGLYLSVNPLGIMEPQAAYGLGVGYIFNDQIDVSTEFSKLSKPTWTDEGKYTNVKGFRSISTIKITTSTDDWKLTRNFIAAELRVKNISFDDMQDFTNTATHATIKDFWFKNHTKSIGIAGMFGKQKYLCESGKWILELTAGIGLKYITVTREHTPSNAVMVAKETGFGEMPNYRNDQTSFYFPLAARIIVKL